MLVQTSVEISRLECSACGVLYFVPADYKNGRQRDHATFYCPNGHNQFFPQETEAERLRKALNQAEIEKTRLANALNAERDAAAKLAQRVAHGVCPCCQRTFKQLSAHMARKHPTFAR